MSWLVVVMFCVCIVVSSAFIALRFERTQCSIFSPTGIFLSIYGTPCLTALLGAADTQLVQCLNAERIATTCPIACSLRVLVGCRMLRVRVQLSCIPVRVVRR